MLKGIVVLGKGHGAESYQQSMTSGVLCISLPHFSQVMVTWSM